MNSTRTKRLRAFVSITKWLALGLAISAGLIMAICAEEDWRAANDLRSEAVAFRAKGEPLEIADFIPPPVPDEENFAAAPYIVELLDAQRRSTSGETPTPKILDLQAQNGVAPPGSGAWELGRPTDFAAWQRYFGTPGDPAAATLTGLSRFSPELQKFADAAARPRARFPTDYNQGVSVALPHLSLMLRFPKIFALRATARLDANDSAGALRDLETLFQIEAALRQEPLLITHLVRLAVLQFEQQVIWQGTAKRQWDTATLFRIEDRLSAMNVISDYAKAIRGERAFSRKTLTSMASQPRGVLVGQLRQMIVDPQLLLPWAFIPWPMKTIVLRNALFADGLIDERLLTVADANAHRVYPRRQTESDRTVAALRTTPYNFIAKAMLPVHRSITIRTANAAIALDEGRLGCAIERFRLANGTLPETLEQLGVPLPNDVMSGSTLKYRRDGADSYILYSVGWNGRDDSGKVARKGEKGNRRDDEQGDWVWFGKVQDVAAPL